jgi:hypothetical protein
MHGLYRGGKFQCLAPHLKAILQAVVHRKAEDNARHERLAPWGTHDPVRSQARDLDIGQA